MLLYIHAVRNGVSAFECEVGEFTVTKSLADLTVALGAIDQLTGWIVHPRLETPEQHGRCRHCA